MTMIVDKCRYIFLEHEKTKEFIILRIHKHFIQVVETLKGLKNGEIPKIIKPVFVPKGVKVDDYVETDICKLKCLGWKGVKMPCSKYKGKQRKACYATDEWKKPVTKNQLKLIKGGKNDKTRF